MEDWEEWREKKLWPIKIYLKNCVKDTIVKVYFVLCYQTLSNIFLITS